MPQSHYFTDDPESPERRRTVRVELAGKEREVVTANGIFSPDGLDKGTAAMLSAVPEPPASGTFLDIGCGWGPLALTLGLTSPDAEIWAVDVNQRSLGLTETNAAALGVAATAGGEPTSSGIRPGVQVALPEAVPAGTTFDLIWSNPPIRVGKQVLHDILLTWLPRLNPGGEAYLVVQKNLGSDSLQTWLEQNLDDDFSVERFARVKAFRVLRVSRA
ncbi:MAG: class I SAM-dependent methyltransferase [Galactobacter sp.]|uniref:class I SAM-dependent methyltransferase n=1 Tax=Galactobacter sp. TaxID=2676125 RepID=UPI0025C3F6B8|nr:methyltransferase [Galactobacter sp.]